MSHFNIIRAWKDEAYRQSLSDSERAQLPANPAGLIELTEDDLEAIAGGNGPEITTTCEYWN
jgi:mersacidin/lichenicidin family type 2 lantibiotic